MFENVGRLSVELDDGRVIQAESVGRLEVDLGELTTSAEAVRNGSRTSVDHAEERGFDSRPPLQPIEQRTHRRDHRRVTPTTGCSWCLEERWDRRQAMWLSVATRDPHVVERGSDVATPATIHAQDVVGNVATRGPHVDIEDIDDDRSSSIDSPSDLPLTYAVLCRIYGRGGKHPDRRPTPAVIAQIRALIACRDASHDDAWCAVFLEKTTSRNIVRSLVDHHALMHAPPAPDPDVLAEAAEADRRRQAYVLRQQLEEGVDDRGRPLGDLARQVAMRQLARLEPQHPAQGP